MVEQMVDCEFEGVAGYVENERATRCQQENERWQEVIFSIRNYTINGLMTDLGLIPILTYDIYLSSVVCPRLLVDFHLTLRSGTAFSRHCALCQ